MKKTKAFIGLILMGLVQCLTAQEMTITQNIDPTENIIPTSTRCRVNQQEAQNDPDLEEGMYFNNYFARAFDLSNDHGIDTDFIINSIGIGVRFAKNITIDINLYTANTTDLTAGNLSLTPVNTLQPINYSFSAAESTNIVNISQSTIINIPVTGADAISSGSILVVEVFAPDSGTDTNTDFAIGSNLSGQTRPSFIKAPVCVNSTDFVDASGFGLQGQSYIMTVTGEPPFDYQWQGEFDNNFGTTRNFNDGAAGTTYRSLTVQADANENEYIIKGTSLEPQVYKWFNENTPLNEEFVLNSGNDASPNSELNSTTSTDNYYTFQIEGFALANAPRNAVVMETGNIPVQIDDINFNNNVDANEDVIVNLTLSANKSPEEKAFIRYSNDEFATSELVEVNFANPTDDTGSATIPGSFNTGGAVQFYAYTTTLDATTSSNHDLISLSKNNNGGTNYAYVVNSEYITKAGATHWLVPTSWLGDLVPPNGANVTIAHNLNLTDNNREVQNLTINDGINLFITGGNTLNINANGNINSPGNSEITGPGIINFVDAGNINGSIEVSNVSINAGVNFGTACTITSNLMLNANGFVVDNAPIYAEDSKLIYQTGGNYNRGTEWSSAIPLAQGTPYHVEIKDNTEFFISTTNNFEIEIQGDLTVNNATFDMDGFVEFDVSVNNIFIENGGEIEMNYTGDAPDGKSLIARNNFYNTNGIITLGEQVGSDLHVRGTEMVYKTEDSNFNSNGRAVIFEGDSITEVTSTGEIVIDFIVIDKPDGKVVFDDDLHIAGLNASGNNDGIILIMRNQALLDLNGFNLTLGNENDITNFDVDMEDEDTKIISTPETIIKVWNNGVTELRFDATIPEVSNGVKELIVDNSGTTKILNDLHVFEKLQLNEATIEANENLIFKSNEEKTAVITEVTNGGSIVGDIRVERHYPMGNRAFRYVSSPVTSTANINTQWQEGQNNNSGINYPNDNSNNNPGFGTHITGSPNGSNGLDATETGNPSLFSWYNHVPNPDWVSMLNTLDSTLTAGQGYALMMRGDRSNNLSSNTATGNSTTLRSWGAPIVGTHVVNTGLVNGNFALIGNPYQAQVDLTKVNKTGFGNHFYIYDPTIGEQGGYATVEINGTVTTTPSTDTEANQYLQVAQAFFIEAVADNPSMTFEEDHKTEDVLNLSTFSVPNYANINLNLFRDGNLLVDGIRINLAEEFSDDIDFEDAPKLWNTQEYIAIDKNQSWLMVEKRTIPENDTIRLFTGNYVASDYQLKIDVQQLDNHEVYLHDAYLNESQLLNNNEQYAYSFSVDPAIPESVHPNRFSLFFNPMPLSTDIALQNNRITCYPNPVTEGTLNVLWPLSANSDNTTLIEVYDVLGRVVFNQKTNANSDTVSINISTLSSGIYVLKASREEQHFTTKISVESN